LLLSEERAEDALQQALLQAWVALRGGAEVQDVRPWLYRIVHNAAVNALRVSGYDYCTLSESLSGADAPQADLDRRIAVREALAGLAALPEMQREALLRTAVEGRSHQQVASDLGVSEPALRGLVYRARTAMRAAAAAIVPPPLLSWALDAGTRGAPVLERVAGVGMGSGSAGVVGLIVKGSAVAVTAGALTGGIVAAHSHKHRTRLALARPSAHTSGVEKSVSPPPGVAASLRPVAFTQPTRGKHSGRAIANARSTHRNAPPAHRTLSPPLRQTPRAPAPAWPHRHRGDGGHQQDERGRPAFGPHAGAVEDSGGPGSRDNHGEGSASTSSHDGRDGGSSPSSQESSDRERHDDVGGSSSSSNSQDEGSGGTVGKDGSGNSGRQVSGSATTTGGGSSSETSWSKDGRGETSGGSGDVSAQGAGEAAQAAPK
jgi:RNA polymerase sigma factor (sigma-70 family)